MRTRTVVCASLLAFILGGFSSAQTTSDTVRARLNAQVAKLPLLFEANKGQVNSKVNFISKGPGYSAFLTAQGMTLSLRGQRAVPPNTGVSVNAPSTIEFRLAGASQSQVAAGEDIQAGHVNYFIGKDRSKWIRNVPVYSRVRYKSVYPGIDLIYYGKQRQLEYDFAVAPGSDPSKICFEIRGARQLRVDASGNLVLQTGTGAVQFQAPSIYQEKSGVRVPVQGGYVMQDSTHIRFQVATYDKTMPLTIDPVLNYSTYLGGSAGDQPQGVSVDASGNVYVTGSTDSTDFTMTSFGPLVAGNTHAFVMKLDPTGSTLIFNDYIGGSSQDYGAAVAVNTSNVYVTGSTTSSDFPLVNAFQPSYPGGYNGFVAKISADGSSLVYSTYLGGNGGEIPVAMAVDAVGEMTVAGYTSSTNFPTANAYQGTVAPNDGGVYGDYGFVTKFTADGSALVFSTYLGGSSNVPLNCGGSPCWPQPASLIMGMQSDASGNVYVAGSTNTYDFPVSSSAYQHSNTTTENNFAGFVTKFTTNGSLAYSTYLGSDLLTQISAIAVDGNGAAYVTGIAFTDGTFPVTSTSICDPSTDGSACNFGFVTKLDPSGTSLQYSTFLGPNNQSSPAAIALDSQNDAFVIASVSGDTGTAVDAMEGYAGGNDLLLVEIDPQATTQVFATYLGGSSDEQPAPGGLTVDSNGNLYAIGTTDSTDFPTTNGSLQPAYGGNVDGFLIKIAGQNAPGVSLSPNSLTFGTLAMGSSTPAQTVLLRNMGSAALAISSITAQGDFSETDNCGGSVPAAGTCSFSIVFSPVEGGTRNGSIVIADDAAGSPHQITLSGTGIGPAVVLSSQSLDFGSVMLGNSSIAQVVSILNGGNMPLNITGMNISGDFTQSNNCPATLAPAQSCSANVIFTPSVGGQRTGSLTITDNGQAGAQRVGLTGLGGILQLSATSTTLTFSPQALHNASTQKSLVLTNSGNASLTMTGIQINGDFAQSNNCPTILAVSATCTVQVTFTPSTTGQRSGILTVSSNAGNSPETISLAGEGVDFTITTAGASQTVKSGSTASYTLNISPVGSAFDAAVKLSCSGNPANTTCDFSSNSVTPGGQTAVVTLSIETGTSALAARTSRPHAQSHYAFWMGLQGLGLFGMFVVTPKRRSKSLTAVASLVIFAALLLTTGCAGGTGIAQQSQTGTTPGTYSITITGASGSLQHTVPLTLTVQ